METRQTTNLKIAGSTPARLVFLIGRKVRVQEREYRQNITALVDNKSIRLLYSLVKHHEYYIELIYSNNKKYKKVDYLTFPSV